VNGDIMTDKAIAPMALGQLTSGVSLRALSEAYTAFPNYGVKVKSRCYLYVVDKDKNLVLENKTKEKRVFSEDTGKIMNQLLSEVVNSGTASSVDIGGDISVAGKTGTAGNNKEKIFIGYTPNLVAGIWCGYNDKRSMSKISPSHLDIWCKVMMDIEEKCGFDIGEKFSTENLVYASYCMDSGKKYSHNCIYDPRGCRMEYGYFLQSDNVYMQECDTHIVVKYDTKNKGVAIICEDDKEYADVSLIKVVDRSFPKEVYITDAEYVYRDVNLNHIHTMRESDLPYFYSVLNDGEFVGISNKKSQFNRLAFPK
jgi:penicillin-binding protein 1A